METIKVKKLDPRAIIPARGTKGAACFDVSILEDVKVSYDKVTLARTGLAFEVPKGYYLETLPRSGYSIKGLRLANVPAVLDSDYRGEWLLELIMKCGYEDMCLKAGDRVMQCQLHVVEDCVFVDVDELTPSERGIGGFGSTGVRPLDIAKERPGRSESSKGLPDNWSGRVISDKSEEQTFGGFHLCSRCQRPVTIGEKCSCGGDTNI